MTAPLTPIDAVRIARVALQTARAEASPEAVASLAAAIITADTVGGHLEALTDSIDDLTKRLGSLGHG